MATPCGCNTTTEPECTLEAGPGITISGTGIITVTAHSAAAWTAYTPTLTNFTLGNGINASRYLLVGKTLDVIIAMRFGTTSTWSGTAFEVGIPAGLTAYFDTDNIMGGHTRGRMSIKDASASLFYKGAVFLSNSSSRPIRFRFGDDATGIGAGGDVRQGTPITFANLDELVGYARFEVL